MSNSGARRVEPPLSDDYSRPTFFAQDRPGVDTQYKRDAAQTIHRKSLVVGPLRCDWPSREVRCRAHCDYARRHSEPSDAEPKPIISTKKGETREIRWNLAKPETAKSMMRFFRGWTQSPNGNLSADRPAAPCGPPRSPSKKRTRGPVCSRRLRINGLDVKIFFFYLYHELNEAVHTWVVDGRRSTAIGGNPAQAKNRHESSRVVMEIIIWRT